VGASGTWGYTGLCIRSIAVSYLHNDLSRTLRSVANPILFADDTSIIISNIDSQEFKNYIMSVMNETISWFQSNH